MSEQRVAIVGTGSRAQMYTRDLAARADHLVVALCDPSPTRMAVHDHLLADAGQPPASQWAPSDFASMLQQESVDLVVVCSVDVTHDEYIVAALDAGCAVVTEKPLTTDADRCRRILQAVERTGGSLRVGFNYRFNPVHAAVRDALRSGVIGEVLSVHFEWLLDVRHGADYFRRWHREKTNSGGLQVHKSGHHFDLLNWWLSDMPQDVFAFGRLAFYGAEAGERHGLRRDYERAHDAAAANDDPFALHLAESPAMTRLYLEAEADSGYVRDRNVFGGPVSIEDDLAVLIRYAGGATVSYHLTAYSPWEGYRVMFNGSNGRVELEVEESQWQPPRTAVDPDSGLVHGGADLPNAGGARVRIRPLWQAPYDLEVPQDHSGHGGGDRRMLDVLFGSADEADLASVWDGARSLGIGLAANRSMTTRAMVDVTDLLPELATAPPRS